MRRLLLLSSALLALLAPASAGAAVTQKKTIWGPVEFQGDSQFPIYKQLGAGIWQSTLDWDQIATEKPVDAKDPEDPSYAWPDELDTAVADGADNGIVVELTVTGTPKWANGNRAAKFAPTDPKDFADFVAAAAKRYPGVHLWSIWDGPSDKAKFRAASTHRYAQLVDGAYGVLHAASKQNRVIGGNSNVSSLGRWLKALTLPGGKRPRMDVYGQDPSASKPPTAASLQALERAVAKAFGKSLKLDLSPTSLPTKASPDFKFHLSEAKQAAWLKAALKLTKRDKDVFSLGYRALYDDSSVPGVARGLMTTDATQKPAYAVFRNG